MKPNLSSYLKKLTEVILPAARSRRPQFHLSPQRPEVSDKARPATRRDIDAI